MPSIIEEYLAVCHRLRAGSFAKKRVFSNSNTSDYCEAGSQLHATLEAEFNTCGLIFTANLPWAVHEITH